MRLAHAGLILSVVILALPNASLAQGRGAVVTKISVDGNVSFNPCTGEGVILSGNILEVLRIETDSNGALHGHLTATGQGVTGVGMSSGTHYHVNGPGPTQTVKVPLEAGAFAGTIVASFHMISPGSGDNFISNVLIHTTVNANGDITASIFSIVPECRG